MGVVGSHEVVGSSDYVQVTSIQTVFSTTDSKMSKLSLTNQLCGDSLPAGCLSRQDGGIYRPLEHSQMSYRLKKEALVKAYCCTIVYGTHMNC